MAPVRAPLTAISPTTVDISSSVWGLFSTTWSTSFDLPSFASEWHAEGPAACVGL
jgi:hypothetical protein